MSKCSIMSLSSFTFCFPSSTKGWHFVEILFFWNTGISVYHAVLWGGITVTFHCCKDLLMNDALDSHLLDFPRFLCVALTQRVTQASCKAPKSILPFSFPQHGLVIVALSSPTRLHRNPCWMLSSGMSHLLRALLAISVCDLNWWRSVVNTFDAIVVGVSGIILLSGVPSHPQVCPSIMCFSFFLSL